MSDLITTEAIASAELELVNDGGIHFAEDEGRYYARDIRAAARLLVLCRAGLCTALGSWGGCPGFRGRLSREGVNHELVVRYAPCRRMTMIAFAKRSEGLIESSRMPTALRAKTLDEYKTSPANLEAFRAVRRALQDPRVGLVLAGPHKVGKTHLGAALVNARVSTGRPALFLVVPELLDELRKTKGRDDALVDLLVTTPLLVLDDLGAERSTDFALEQLFLVTNGRVNQGRQLVVTTNYTTPEQLIAQLGGSVSARRVVERIAAACTWLVVGEDLTLL
jgi:DNA replication protein DnaC